MAEPTPLTNPSPPATAVAEASPRAAAPREEEVSAPPLVSFIIPAYNEQDAVVDVVQEIIDVVEPLGVPYEMIVIDDGSTDETRARCEALPGVRVVAHGRNRGEGAARTTGTRVARGKYVITTDADGTYPASAIPAMIEAIEECDMVIGARTREMGTMRLLRSFAKEFIRLLASYMTRTHIPDLNSGLRAMRREKVLEFLPILPTTHSWVSTITMAFLSTGYDVRWIPIPYYKRIGRSSFHPIADTYNYLSLVVRAIMYFDPLRVFLPVTLLLFGLGFAKLVYDAIAYHWHFTPSVIVLILAAFQIGAMGLLADLIVRRCRR
jgi:glycosyltransferase involved in cell wall biosynthesis